MRTRVTAQSQPHRLRQRLEEAGIAHGQEIRADLTGVRVAVGSSSPGDLRFWLPSRLTRAWAGEVFFCTMGPIRVRESHTAGDDEPLPRRVVLEGLEVRGPGSFDILNALVQSNGDIRVLVDRASRVVESAEE